jgi:hypothetical protein
VGASACTPLACQLGRPDAADICPDSYALIRDDSEVQVDASDGTITLSGHVRTWAEHDAVLDAAWMGIGVSNVSDNLVITG